MSIAAGASGASGGPAPLGYGSLTPGAVLDALDAVGLRGDGRILQLNSYENRVFQLFLEDGSAVVAKFYRPGRWSDAQILEEHAFARELDAEEVPVVAPRVLRADDPGRSGIALQPADAPTLASLPGPGGHRFGVSPRCAGRSPELEQTGTLERLGRFLGRLHAVGRRRRFEHRWTMDPAADAAAARQALLAGDFVPPDQAAAWADASAAAVAAIGRAMAATSPLTTLRLHGDAHVGNVLWRDDRPNVVDLDDACNGPAVQDLWMLVSGDAGSAGRQLDALLAGYRAFCDFDPRELRLVEALRTLRMLRYSAWIAARWDDPAFPAAFPFFGDGAWWSQQTTQLREQRALVDEQIDGAGP